MPRPRDRHDAEFIENADGTYDLHVDRRAVDYDIDPSDFYEALRRSRLTPDAFWVQDSTGFRTRHPTRLGR